MDGVSQVAQLILNVTSGTQQDIRALIARNPVPGANHPSTLSAAGSPPEFLNKDPPPGGAEEKDEEENVVEVEAELAAAAAERDEAWFRTMWLSNRDFLRYCDAALDLDASKLRGGERRRWDRGPNFAVVNAMSGNAGRRWCLRDTEALLEVAPLDDSMAAACP